MKKELIKAKCSQIDEEGNGVIIHNGKVVQIPYMLEGEAGMVQITKHREQVYGRLVEQTQKSPLRAEPPCPHYFECGGCQLQHMSEKAQIAFKQGVVERFLKPFGTVGKLIPMAHPFGYRNKSHTTYGMSRGLIISGIYESKSHRLTSVDRCMIQNEKADAIALTIRGLLPSFKLMPYDEDSEQGFLRHVLIRTGYYTGQIMVVLVTASPVFPSKSNFVKKLLSLHPEITTLVMNVNKRKTSMVLGQDEVVLYGKGNIEDKLCDITFQISPRSFYQINSLQTEVLYGKAIEFAGLTGKEKVLDAYCGIGTISLIASQKSKEVIGVELNADAVKDAIANAKRNGIKNVRFIKADAGDFMLQMAENKEKFDVVIMDPPRSGSDERFLKSVLILAPKTVIYVSCNPVTQARDLKVLTQGGYKVTEIQPVDLFPQTYHVECVVKLEKGEAKILQGERPQKSREAVKAQPANKSKSQKTADYNRQKPIQKKVFKKK